MISPKKIRWIENLWWEGLSVKEIVETTNVPQTTVSEILKRDGYHEGKEMSSATKFWLLKNWHFKPIKKPEQKPGKYRKVRRGEVGHLKTPYRPDRIFR